MKPANCCVCGKAPVSIDDGDWIKFRDYDENGTKELSHPRGLEYFCNEHIEEAIGLTHLELEEALNKLKIIHSAYEKREENPSLQKKLMKEVARIVSCLTRR